MLLPIYAVPFQEARHCSALLNAMNHPEDGAEISSFVCSVLPFCAAAFSLAVVRDEGTSLPPSLHSLLASLAGRDTPDLVGTVLGKPEVAIGSCCDPEWEALGGWCGKLGDAPSGCDTPDLVGTALGKPEVAIGSCCDRVCDALGGWYGKLGDVPSGCDTPDLVGTALRKPEVAIGSCCDRV